MFRAAAWTLGAFFFVWPPCIEALKFALAHNRDRTAAEYIVLPSAQAVTLPEHIGYAEGACFGIPALTALQAVRKAAQAAGVTLRSRPLTDIDDLEPQLAAMKSDGATVLIIQHLH